jgi:hypothetical protein
MKCYKRVIDSKTGMGFIKLEAHDMEDMWHAYVPPSVPAARPSCACRPTVF